jgi:hypothetical protein
MSRLGNNLPRLTFMTGGDYANWLNAVFNPCRDYLTRVCLSSPPPATWTWAGIAAGDPRNGPVNNGDHFLQLYGVRNTYLHALETDTLSSIHKPLEVNVGPRMFLALSKLQSSVTTGSESTLETRKQTSARSPVTYD